VETDELRMPKNERIHPMEPSPEYDSPWKEILEDYFEDFMAFFFPKAHEDID
jgi:hypothetical protein